MIRAALLTATLVWASSALAQPVSQIQQPIYFGEREPASIRLTAGQILSIGWLHPRGAPGNQFCTGNVIEPDIVLTTRHCFDQALDNTVESDPLAAEFSVGQSPTAVQATSGVINAVFHPHYDLVVLQLAAPITEMAPVEILPMIGTPLADGLVGSTAEAAGHGRTEAEADKVGLFFVPLPITCANEAYVEVFGGGTRGICAGDSGGPLIVAQPDGRPGILSIEHQGDSNCVGRDYLIRLDRQLPWISEAIDRLRGVVGDPCNGLTYRGRCVGTQVEWCDGGQVLFQECAETGQVCGLLDPQQGLFCREPVPCEEDTPKRCSGGMVVQCVDGFLREEDCVAVDKVCATSPRTARCVAPCGVTDEDVVDDGAGPFRRPGEPVVFKGVFDINCATGPGRRPAWWIGLLLLGLCRRR